MGKTLAQIVAIEKLLPEPRLAAAIARVAESGEPLFVQLVELEHVSEVRLTEALSRHLGLNVLTELHEPELDALRQVPHDLARARRVVPLELTTPAAGPRTLRLAVADPTDGASLGELESATGCRVEPVLASLAAIDDALGRVYRGLVTAVMARTDRPAGGRRVPFGGNLAVNTPAGEAGARGGVVHTAPYHNVEEEAPLEQRHRALLEVLIGKGLITEDEYWAELRKLLVEHD